MLLPGQQALFLGRSPFWGVAVAHGRLPSPHCTCGWVSEGLVLPGGLMREFNPVAVGKMDQEGLCLAPGQVCL